MEDLIPVSVVLDAPGNISSALLPHPPEPSTFPQSQPPLARNFFCPEGCVAAQPLRAMLTVNSKSQLNKNSTATLPDSGLGIRSKAKNLARVDGLLCVTI